MKKYTTELSKLQTLACTQTLMMRVCLLDHSNHSCYLLCQQTWRLNIAAKSGDGNVPNHLISEGGGQDNGSTKRKCTVGETRFIPLLKGEVLNFYRTNRVRLSLIGRKDHATTLTLFCICACMWVNH